MKCQLATVEALLGLLVAVSGIVLMVRLSSGFSAQLGSGVMRLKEGGAVYDFYSALESNATARACVLGLNITCMNSLLRAYEGVYGVSIGISVDGVRVGNASPPTYCLLVSNSVVCIEAGG
ncbi:MAG: hypothetical protein ACP5T3_02450 [Candidatus Micrarchaeia archaeon]